MIIQEEERGLLFSKSQFVKVLLPGNHTVPPFHRLELSRVEQPFAPKTKPLDLLLSKPSLASELEVIEVKDDEIALHFEDGLFKNVIATGKWAWWKSFRKRHFILVSLSKAEIDLEIDRSLLLKPQLKDHIIAYSVESWQKGLLFIDKSFVRILDSGNYFFWKGTQSVNVEKVDLRQQQLEISGQEIMSKDKVPLRLNFFCQFTIVDVMKAGHDIKDYEKQFHVVLQLALREYVGALVLDEILEKKEEIGRYVGEILKQQAEVFGLSIGYSGIKDIILPGEIRDIINQVLIAEKKSQANVIMRREETASTRSLLNTAKLMEENEVLYRLKELEYIERISERISQITVSGGNQIVDQLRQMFVPESNHGKKSQ